MVTEITTKLPDSYRAISLTKGQIAIVDVVDYDWLSPWSWHAEWNAHICGYYASRGQLVKTNTWRLLRMHRAILGLEYGDPTQGDFINGNTLDLRRLNLRVANAQQNVCNRWKRRDNTSGYKGVSLFKRTGRWDAQISVRGKKLYLGSYKTPEEAHEAYQQAAKIHHCEFANFG